MKYQNDKWVSWAIQRKVSKWSHKSLPLSPFLGTDADDDWTATQTPKDVYVAKYREHFPPREHNARLHTTCMCHLAGRMMPSWKQQPNKIFTSSPFPKKHPNVVIYQQKLIDLPRIVCLRWICLCTTCHCAAVSWCKHTVNSDSVNTIC